MYRFSGRISKENELGEINNGACEPACLLLALNLVQRQVATACLWGQRAGGGLCLEMRASPALKDSSRQDLLCEKSLQFMAQWAQQWLMVPVTCMPASNRIRFSLDEDEIECG